MLQYFFYGDLVQGFKVNNCCLEVKLTRNFHLAYIYKVITVNPISGSKLGSTLSVETNWEVPYQQKQTGKYLNSRSKLGSTLSVEAN